MVGDEGGSEGERHSAGHSPRKMGIWDFLVLRIISFSMHCVWLAGPFRCARLFFFLLEPPRDWGEKSLQSPTVLDAREFRLRTLVANGVSREGWGDGPGSGCGSDVGSRFETGDWGGCFFPLCVFISVHHLILRTGASQTKSRYFKNRPRNVQVICREPVSEAS
jgi:hypothetical protein